MALDDLCQATPGNPKLEEQLQAELNLPGRSRQAYCAGLRSVDRRDRQAEIRMIEEVEEFGAELQSCALGYRERFGDGDVEIHQAGAAQNVSAGIAEVIRTGPAGALRQESRDVEPVVYALSGA